MDEELALPDIEYKTRGVVVLVGGGVSESFEDRIGLKKLLLKLALIRLGCVMLC